MTTILLIDARPVSRIGLKLFLRYSLGKDVCEAASHREAIELLRRRAIDLVLLNTCGITNEELLFIDRSTGDGSPPPLLVLGNDDDTHCAADLLHAGAAGFLARSRGTLALMESMDRILAQRTTGTPLRLDHALSTTGRNSEPEAPHRRLSGRELQIFHLLALGNTVSDIARELQLSVKTISTHRSRILDKTRLRNNADIVRYARRTLSLQSA